MGFDDRHLDFRIVVTVAAGVATLTTIVRRRNCWAGLTSWRSCLFTA